MRVRLEDVARAAGVSPKTVSRVLNDEANVRESTRERVRAVVAELDYRPHLSARSLASNHSYMIATLYDNPSSSYLTEVQDGVLEACDQHHYSMLVRPLDAEAADFVERVDTLISSHRPDGLVLTPPVSDHPGLLQRLHERGVIYASVSPKQRAGTIGVYMDEEEAARQIVTHLVELGHRRIAHASATPSTAPALAPGRLPSGAGRRRHPHAGAAGGAGRFLVRFRRGGGPASCSLRHHRRRRSSPATTTWPRA